MGDSFVASTATLSGNAFSVGGSTLVVANGMVGIGAAPSNSGVALQVTGLITATNANAAPIHSTQPGSRYAPPAANTWYYTGESVTFTVPAGPSQYYRIVMRQMIANGNAGTVLFSVGNSNSSSTGFLFQPYIYIGASSWTTVNAETVVSLAPGTYSYYVWVDVGVALSGPSIADASTDNRLYCDLFVQPL